MTQERLNALLRVTGNLIPEAMEEHIADLEASGTELLPRETLQAVLDENRVPEAKQRPLFAALDAANVRSLAAALPDIAVDRIKNQLLSCVQLFATPWTVTHQVPLSMEFSRQEYWSGLPFPAPSF